MPRGTQNPARSIRACGSIAPWSIKGEVQTTTNNNKHIVNIIQAPVKEFTSVRMIMRSYTSTNSPGSVPVFGGGAGIIAAVTESNSSHVNPVINGDATAKSLTNDPTTGWCQLKWNNQLDPVVPLVDNTFGLRQSTYSMSDWLYMPSLAPTNGAAYPFVLFATWLPASVPTWTYMSPHGGIGSEANLLDKGCYVQGVDIFKASNSFVTNPETYSGITTGTTGLCFFHELHFLAKQPVVNIMGVGDSMFAGQGSSDGHYVNSFYTRACRRMREQYGYSVNAMNYGWGSQGSATYLEFGKNAVAFHKPDIVLYSVFTTNDGTITNAIASAQYARAMEFAAFCRQVGSLCVFTFCSANNNWTGPQDDIRKALIAKCKRSGIPTFDLTPFTSTEGWPQRIKTGHNFDTIHLNDTGYDAAADGLAPMLMHLIDENFSDVRILTR